MARTARNLPKERMERRYGEQETESIFTAALYARLSIEDSGKSDEQTLRNQISVLKDYVSGRPDFKVYEIYADNGFSGTNFMRPQFQKMMAAVQEGKINCIIVKDLSRFGRNYLETGNYIETLLPLMGVRLIAVNEGYDSFSSDQAWKLLMPLKNVLNEVYAKDISRKVSSAVEVKIQEGKPGGGVAPYGYLRYRDSYRIDPLAAENVRRIFFLRAAGESYLKIARLLNMEGVMSPSAYRYAKGLVYSKRFEGVLWKRHVLKEMLENRVYLGDLTRGKTKTAIYRGERRHRVLPEQQKVFSGTHEAIIEEALFQKVQSISDERREQYNRNLGKYSAFNRAENVLGRKVLCADCGAVLILYRKVVRQKDLYDYYICPNYSENKELACSKKSISKVKLDESIYRLLKLHAELFLNFEEVIEKRKRADGKNSSIRAMQLQQEEKRRGRLNYNLYLDYKRGSLTEMDYRSLKKESLGIEQQQLSAGKSSSAMDTLTQEWVKCFIYGIKVHQGKHLEICLNYQDEMGKIYDGSNSSNVYSDLTARQSQ